MKHKTKIPCTNQFLNRVTIPLITVGLTIQVLLTGCASANRRDDAIDTILAKESALIEKVKLERSQPEVAEGVSQNESLKKSEGHLLMALDELLKANDLIQRKLIKQNKSEVNFERR